ncbi:hypothetical protein FACS1894172_06260 [Spirochaetia bacterium]|nr:hypothetical protein FACS1894172_06260 [Spirochaetia bacterium]
MIDLFSEETEGIKVNGTITVVKADFLEAYSCSWDALFDGFNRFYAITYSSSVDFICKVLKKIASAEIIFGFEKIISHSLQEVMAYQDVTIERLREGSSQNKIDLISRIDSGSLKLFVARKQLSHEKIYLLEADDGRKRVITGSANLSNHAFSGIQRENICYFDGDDAFNWYFDHFQRLKNDSSDDITVKAIAVADAGEHLDTLPIAKTVAVKKMFAFIPEPVNSLQEEAIRFALNVENLAKKISPFMPQPDKKGMTLIVPDTITQIKRRIIAAQVQEKELRSEYPELLVDCGEQTAILNGTALDIHPEKKDIVHDVSLFLEYMTGFEKFHGDINPMQARYFELFVWFFASPFMAALRTTAALYNHSLFPYPAFGLVYGQSKAGKTSFLETLLKMMIGQKTKIAARDFTRTSIDKLKWAVKGAPVIVDDIDQIRFKDHGVETIKNDDFGVADRLMTYPAVIISANEDVKVVAPELVRRMVIFRIRGALTNSELMKSNTVRRIQKNIGTAFYREYLGRMLPKVSEMLRQLCSDEEAIPPDVLAASSTVIVDIISETTPHMPDFIRLLSLDNYFDEKITGSFAIKTICDIWRTNKKAFSIDRHNNELRYNAGQTYEADRIIKELPESLEARRSREWVVMNLSKARDFFGINFRKKLLF